MRFTTDSHLDVDVSVLKAAIIAIEKAVSEDVPQHLYEHRLETNNYASFIRGDYINQNLREATFSGIGELIPFHRYGWNGRLLLDECSKLTYSIASQSTVHQIPRRHRNKPHFLQTLLQKENGDLRGSYEQMSFLEQDRFDDETYNADFYDITGGRFDPEEGYYHCVIAYRAENNQLVEVELVLMDSWFNVVEKHDIGFLRELDFAALTAPVSDSTNDSQSHNTATRSLAKLKTTLPHLAERKKVEDL